MNVASEHLAEQTSEWGNPFEVIDSALVVLQDEREVFLSGEYEKLPVIIERKVSLLDRIESLIHTAPKSASFIAAVRRLIDASRRNEEIIQAARQGHAHAKRRLKAIADMRDGVVAYAEDGSTISSRADAWRGGKSA